MSKKAGKVLEPEVLPPLPQSKLLSDGRKTQRLTRAELVNIETPSATATFQPVQHSMLVDCLEEALSFRHISIVRDDYAVSPDGMKLFGLLELNADFEGVRFAIGLRNSNAKTMRLGMVAGYRVTVCDNMMLSGDFKPLLAKHSKNFDLVESVSIGVDRIQRGFRPLEQAIRTKRDKWLTEDEARLLIYRAFIEGKFPITPMKAVHRNFFNPPYPDFEDRTLWSLENAFTEAFKGLNPVPQYEVTAKLGKFLQPYLANN